MLVKSQLSWGSKLFIEVTTNFRSNKMTDQKCSPPQKKPQVWLNKDASPYLRCFVVVVVVIVVVMAIMASLLRFFGCT